MRPTSAPTRRSLGELRGHLEAVVRGESRVVAHDPEEVIRRKIDRYYWPMIQWINEVVDDVVQRHAAPRCVMVGLSAVQGGGKTTASRMIQEMMRFGGRRCAVLSLDDVYLTRERQIALAATYPDNPLLQHRGNPGTQDLPVLLEVIEQCKKRPKDDVIAIPRYEKSLHQGRGDRLPTSAWERVEGPLDVLLIEGWCLGFRPLVKGVTMSPHLEPVNTFLEEFERLNKELDAMIVIQAEDPRWVYRWREQQESHLREMGKPALTADEVRDFVDRFMPAYEAYLPGLYATARDSTRYQASVLDTLPQLRLSIASDRRPLDTHQPVEMHFSSKIISGKST